MEDKERKNRTIALITSLGVHLAVLLAFLFLVAWRAPNPPLAEYGIELNFGMDTQGMGDIQPETPVNTTDEQQAEEVKQEDQQTEEVKEEKVEEAEIKKETEVQPVAKEESPVVVKETRKEKEVKEKKEPVKEPVVEKKQEAKEANVADSNKEGKKANQGDDKNKVGDKGNPEGSLDAKALYGKQGGGAGGSGLDLDGWQWDTKPNPHLPNEEPGILVFEIKVDASGEIVSIKTLQRGLSLEAEKICRKEVEKLTFTQTGKNVPDISTGKITFRVIAK